ncbi:thiol peroxidase [Pseudofulvibacter geojedonensis]|uniref:Thiol peroxidase n=1 Tax=Pseudofulvibacter geojedonensis TaxID=1123758 RepID=A0ABW3I1X7_9FLAO
MATVTLKGNPINTSGSLPAVGSTAPDFTLVKTDLSTASLSDYKGQAVVLNIFPSIDTGTCAQSVRQFNKDLNEIQDVKVLCISRDLPFAQARFCGAEGLDNVINLSDFRDNSFGKAYGLDFIDGPLEGLHSRVIIVIDENGIITHTEQVPEIVDEPNYKAAFEAL